MIKSSASSRTLPQTPLLLTGYPMLLKADWEYLQRWNPENRQPFIVCYTVLKSQKHSMLKVDQFVLLLLLHPCCLLGPLRTSSLLSRPSSHQQVLPERKLPLIEYHKIQGMWGKLVTFLLKNGVLRTCFTKDLHWLRQTQFSIGLNNGIHQHI